MNPLASRLTQRHRRALQALSGSAARRARGVLQRARWDAVAEWWAAGAGDELVDTVRVGHERAVALTVQYLYEHARLHSAEVDPLPAVIDLGMVRGTLWTVGPEAFLVAMAHKRGLPAARRVMVRGVVGSVQRLVLAGDRDTVVGTWQAGR